MKLSHFLFSVLTVASAIACSSEIAPHEAATTSHIVGGKTDSADDAVAYILIEADTFVEGCTGTLIGPNVVLTAGHCGVADEKCTGGDGSKCEPAPVQWFTVYGGATPVDSDFKVATPSWTAKVREIHPHPDYVWNGDGTMKNDVAVFILDAIDATSGTQPTPVAWLRTPNEAVFAEGASFRAVGFGLTDGATKAGGGTKKEVPLTIASHDDMTFSYGGSADGSTCSGDSGGPAFAKISGVETLIGTTSSGNTSCTEGGSSMRVDAFAAFIGQHAGGATSSPPSPSKASGPGKSSSSAPPAQAGAPSKPSAGTCQHSVCDAGVALDQACDPCVATICDMDPDCCTKGWNSFCVADVLLCDVTCK